MEETMSLTECMRTFEQSWYEEFKQEAKKGSIEAQITYSQVDSTQMLLRGVGTGQPNLSIAIQYLRNASKRSAEACLRLGKMYFKGKHVLLKVLYSEQIYFLLNII